MKRNILILLFVSLLVGLTVSRHTPDAVVATTEQKAQVGFAAPHFSLKGLDTQSYQFNGKRQKPLVLNFWASWCGPCRMEAPQLQKLYVKYRGQLDFYAVNVTSNDNLEDAKAFVEAYKLTFPVPLDVKGDIADLYRVNAFPTTYLIDRNGVIRQKIVGMIEPASFEQELKKLVSQ
jgi:cytochrome c biogenesis protein CcmG/thiol:disulfide interchange protein DsbE